MKHGKGFTLIELVVVIVILAILAVIVAPRFLNLSSEGRASRLEAISASISSGLESVHFKSVINGTENDINQSSDDYFNVWFGYPMIFNSTTLRQVVDLSLCIEDEFERITDHPIESCSQDSNYFFGLVEDLSEGVFTKMIYILEDNRAVNAQECRIIVNNAQFKHSKDGSTLLEKPSVTAVVSGC